MIAATPAMAQVKAPQITPLSPNAAALWKYAELPVNMYTGIPSISIPIYEIKSGGLTVPISLSYHAGGIRYEEQASWVGLGWTLNAGGAINRNVKGVADERGILHPYNQYNPLASGCDYEYFNNVLNKTIDAEADEFSFNMPGKSGRFVFDPATKQPITIPYDPIKLNYTVNPTYAYGFTSPLEIIDENGTSFKYGATETTNGGTGAYTEELFPASWLLTEMKSADAARTITFNYVPGESWTQKLSRVESISVSDQSAFCSLSSGVGSLLISNLNYLTDTKYLSEILFENGKIQFVQSGNYRTDLHNFQRSLEYIRIYSKEGATYKLIKSVKFFYSYFQRIDAPGQSADWKLKLDKIQVRDALDNNVEETNFEYNTNFFTTQYATYGIDYWGYYNGSSVNTNLVPRQDIYYQPSISPGGYISIGGAISRDPNPVFMTEGVLNKIIYPTGGFSQFEYEINKYKADNGSGGIETGNAGGLRVTKITSASSATDIPLTKTYKYGLNEDGYGFKNFTVNLYHYQSSVITAARGDLCNGGGAGQYTRTFKSQGSLQTDGNDGSSVLYPYVKVYEGIETNNNGWTEYVYDNGNPTADVPLSTYTPLSTIFYRQSNSWQRGNLTLKTVFGKNGQKILQTKDEYQLLNPVLKNAGTLIWQSVYFDVTCLPCLTACGQYKYAFTGYSVTSGAFRPQKTTETVYDINDPSRYTINTTSYVYDANYLQPLEVNKGLRKLQTGYEEQIIDYAKYPFNYTFTGAPVGSEAQGIKLLQDKNIIAAPVEQYTVKKYKNPTVWQSDVTAGTITTFRSDKPYPDKIWQLETTTPISAASFGTGSSIVANAFTKNANYTEKLAFISYDAAGNITQYNKTNDINNAYIWDYANTYPIAEVANATTTNIAFTSFEAEGNGNWVFSGTPAADATAPTGKKAYTLNGVNNIVKSGLTAGTTYIVSYWIKNTSPLTITGTIGSATAGRTLGLWKYYEHRITGQTQVTISGSLPIDELRLYPVGALMNTYTHEPLVGLSSQCDAQNKISYYEYDNMNRLLLIRDQDKNILKTFEYKYKN
jgi:hypothetical protein